MNPESGAKRAEEVRRMFTRIASRYNRLNRLMTFGQDRHWRRETIRSLALNPGEWLLDIGTGTGDLAYEAIRQRGQLRVIACDFTSAMIQYGQGLHEEQPIQWVIADAQSLPFASKTFDAVVSGFLLRNVVDLKRTLGEQARILKLEGRIACLDTTPPQAGPFRPLILLYLRWIIPTLGRWIAGDERAYRYLPDTTRDFLPAPELARVIQSCGFKAVSYVRRMLGTIAIHRGVKSKDDDVAASLEEPG